MSDESSLPDDLPRKRRRELREHSTKPEQLIWAALRNRRVGGLKFRRQHSIGPFIVDFLCKEKDLVIEIDGGYHAYVGEADLRRQRYLETHGFKVIRFTNEDVLEDAEGVVVGIAKQAGVKLDFH